MLTHPAGACLSWLVQDAPTGKNLVFSSGPLGSIWILPVVQAGSENALIHGTTPIRAVRDGLAGRNWMAYAADESGRMQVYVQPFLGLGAKIPVSTEGESGPHGRTTDANYSLCPARRFRN